MRERMRTDRYLVSWKIDIDADSPIEAAIEARRIQQDVDSQADHFEVYDQITGVTTEVNVMEW
jgi:predicted GNAT superfamily acetyltransferase